MNRPHFCILISVTCFSMAIAAPVQNEDMDIREPLDRYYTAVARIARDAEKRNQTEVRRLTVALKNALNAVRGDGWASGLC